jgi:signal transduction histidine kinase/Tfp pilus assembly protein PilF
VFICIPNLAGVCPGFFWINFPKLHVYEIFGELTKKRIYLLSLILSLGCYLGFGQTTKIDSLNLLLPSLSSDEKRFDLLIATMQEYFSIHDYESALRVCNQALEIAQVIGDSSKIVRSGRSAGIILNRMDRSLEASRELSRVLPIAKRNNIKSEYTAILNNLGIALTFQARYDEALKIHLENLTIRETDNDIVGMVNSLNNIGLVYFKLKNYNHALEYYLKALSHRDEVEIFALERVLINIGLCQNQLKRFEDALKYFNQAFQICHNQCTDQIEIEGKFGLGVSNYGLGNFEDAKVFFKESFTTSKKINNIRFQAENLVYLAHIFVIERDYSQALEALAKADSIAHRERFNEILIETYREYSNVYKLLSDYEKASEYQSKYIHIKDSIYNERLIDNIARVQTEYAERENIKTIASNQVVIKQQRDLNIAIAIIAILAGLLILVLQRSNRVSKQVNAQLSEAKETIQQQNKLLEIKNKDLDREVEKKTVDLERVNISLKQVNDELDNFIYKTSHDIRGPLASLKGMCNVALMDVKDPVALDYLRKLDATAERLNSILTRLLIVNQINNSKISVSKIDFEKIINDIILLEKKRGLPPKIEIRKRIEPALEIQSDKELVRIVLENLIDNAIKFYNDSDRVDSFVEIDIAPSSDGTVKARIIDNGIGISEANPGKLFQMFFRASERSEIGGIGLYIVKTATSKIGGKVGLLTTPEGYTEFYVVFPATPPSPDEWPPKNNL